VVLFDPGGPGLPLPDGDVRDALPALLRTHDVLIAFEPWIRKKIEKACAEGQADFSDTEKASACDPTQFVTSVSDTKRLIRATTETTSRPIVGFYLRSFGAARLQSYLASVAPQGRPPWVVFDSPAPPVGTSAIAIARGRATSVYRLISRECREAACHSAVKGALGSVAKGQPPEIGLGLLALATSPTRNSRFFSKFGQELAAGRLTKESEETLRSLGRRYGLLNGSEAKSQLVGLWADTCPRYVGWDDLQRSSDALVHATGWLFRGCQSHRTLLSQPGKIRLPVLRVTWRADTISPARLQQAWAQATQNEQVIYSDGHELDSSRVAKAIRKWVTAHEGP
jgi:hypothetical protein